MFRLVSWTRLLAAAAVVALLPLAGVLPSVAAIAVLATVLAALNAVEYARVEHIGWRALLRGREARIASAG
jgi:hypothetical protein